MEEKNKLEQIYKQIDGLRMEFEKMAHPNPYHLWLSNYTRNGKSNNGKMKGKSKGENFSINKYYMYPLFLGVVLVIFTIAATCIVLRWLHGEEKSIYTILAVLMSGVVFPIIIYVNTESFDDKKLKPGARLVFYFVCAGFMILGITNHNSTTREIILIICLISPIVSYFWVFYPLSRKVFNRNISEKLDELQKELEELNKEKQKIFLDEIRKSHESIENKINNIETRIIVEEDNKNLLKFLKLSVLDALKMELVQSSNRGLELTRNWQFVKLSQKMLDKIMGADDKNKHITLVGDLSFLSHEEGLKDLFETVIQRGKTFDIYFAGQNKSGKKNVVLSDYFNHLVNSFNRVVLSYSDEQIKTFFKNVSISLMPVNYFTGLGYIGLKEKREKEDYNEVYSFVSSSLLPDKESKNIAKANPFVFSWNDRTHYFHHYISGIEMYPKPKIEYNEMWYEDPIVILEECMKVNKIKIKNNSNN